MCSLSTLRRAGRSYYRGENGPRSRFGQAAEGPAAAGRQACGSPPGLEVLFLVVTMESRALSRPVAVEPGRRQAHGQARVPTCGLLFQTRDATRQTLPRLELLRFR